METYEELERKMVAAVGRERTDEIRQMAKDITDKRASVMEAEKKCPALRYMRLISEHSIYGSFGDRPNPKEVSSMDNGFIQMALEMGESNLAMTFLQYIYKMTMMEALEHIAKVMKKKRVIEASESFKVEEFVKILPDKGYGKVIDVTAEGFIIVSKVNGGIRPYFPTQLEKVKDIPRNLHSEVKIKKQKGFWHRFWFERPLSDDDNNKDTFAIMLISFGAAIIIMSIAVLIIFALKSI